LSREPLIAKIVIAITLLQLLGWWSCQWLAGQATSV